MYFQHFPWEPGALVSDLLSDCGEIGCPCWASDLSYATGLRRTRWCQHFCQRWHSRALGFEAEAGLTYDGVYMWSVTVSIPPGEVSWVRGLLLRMQLPRRSRDNGAGRSDCLLTQKTEIHRWLSNLIFSNNFILLSDFIENKIFLLPLRPELLTRIKWTDLNFIFFHFLRASWGRVLMSSGKKDHKGSSKGVKKDWRGQSPCPQGGSLASEGQH